MHTLLETILEDTYSLTLLKARIRALRNYADQKAYLKEVTITPEDQAWLTTLIPKIKDPNLLVGKNIEQTFEELNNDVQSLPQLVMYVAIELPPSSLAEIGKKLRAYNSSLLIDLRLNPQLIGGAALAYKGILKDYSMQSKMTNMKAFLQTELNLRTKKIITTKG